MGLLWIGVAVLVAALAVASVISVPARLAQLATECQMPACEADQLGPAEMSALRSLVIPVGLYAGYFTAFEALIALGVPASKILIETESRNTHDEAVIIAPKLRGLNVEHVVLVTSRDHMRRSLGAFRAVGVRAIPAIAVDPYTPDSWIGWIVPSQLGLWKSATVMHELIGIPHYIARGWYGFR